LTLPTTYNWFIALLGSGIEDGAARLPVLPREYTICCLPCNKRCGAFF